MSHGKKDFAVLIQVQFSSVAQSCPTLCDTSLSITNSWSQLKLMFIESVMPSSHLALCRPLLLLPPTPPSIRVFSNESNLRMRWPKYWSFSFSISPSSEHPGLISFRMDWLTSLKSKDFCNTTVQFSSVSHSVVSDSLRPHELQHARPPCPSPTPGVHSNSCASSQ